MPASPVSGATSRVTLSSRGRIFIAVGLISTLAGLAVGVEDLVRVGVLLLVLPLPAWFGVRHARAGLRVEHDVQPARVSVGEKAEVRLVLSNPQVLATGPLRVSESVPGGRPLRFSVAGVKGRQRRTVSYPLPSLGRGRHVVGPTTVTASDPFGLVVADARSANTAELVVRPHLTPLAALPLPAAWRDGSAPLSHSVGVGGSDDTSVRQFRHGDDLRKIHWRSTARAGTVMVRQEERPWHGESLVLLDTRISAYPVNGQGGESAAFEWAVSAAASIGAHLCERRRRVTAVTGDGRVAHDDVSAVLDLMAETNRAVRTDLTPLATALASLGRDCSVFAILAGTSPAALAELLDTPRSPGSTVALLVRPVTWLDGDHAACSDEAWQSCADALRTRGWRVVAGTADADLAELWPTLLSAPVRDWQ